MIREQSETEQRLIQAVLVVDIDPGLTLFKPSQQKWVSSLELLAELPKDTRPNCKIINLMPSVYLLVGYCQKNRPPIYEVDFVSHPSQEWIALKSPSIFADKYSGVSLCFKAGDNPLCQPLTDLELLITERKRVNEEKQVFILPPGYKIVNNNPITHSFLIYKRMRSPLQQSFKAILLENYPERQSKIALNNVPLFCFPEGIHLAKELKGFINFNFILTTEEAVRIYCNCLTFRQTMEDHMKQQLGIPLNDRVYYEKAICLVSKHRYTDQFAECLTHLYRLSMSKNDVPFHRVISSFVEGLLLPKELGINGMSYSYGGSNINFETNPSYPTISERAIFCMFKFLPVSAIISIFEAILLQKKIIFVSQSKTVLGYAVEAFQGFIFPFRWEQIIIPILPSTLKDYLTAPVPIIIGISPNMLDRSIESDSIIVQLDNATILNDQDLPPLPDKLEKQLKRRLEPFELYDQEEVRQFLENPESTYIFKMQEVEHPEFQGHIIRDYFYEFILTLMKNYKKFWKTQKYKDKENSSIGLTEPQLLGEMFKLQDFLSDLGMTKVGSFGYKLTECSIFTSFIERKYQFQDDPQLMFFDESIDKKKAKKDIRIMQRPTNIRYNVAKHPQPELVKTIYVYERFPSILGKELSLKQVQIKLSIDSVNQQELEALQDFLETELKHNQKLFSQSEATDIDFKIQSLLLERYRIKYQDYCQQEGKNKVQTIRSTLVPKHRNTRQLYDKLQLFEKLYLEQSSYIEDFFMNWPYERGQQGKVQEISKRQYLKKYLRVEQFPEDELICIYDECYGYNHKNYQTMILGSTKLILLQSQDHKSSLPSLQNLRNSKKKVKYVYQVYFQHFKIKNFMNKILPSQAYPFFHYAIQKVKQNSFIWNLQTLVEWKRELQKKQQ